MSNSVVAPASSQNYFVQLTALARLSVVQLVRAPVHARRAAATQRLVRHALLLVGVGGALVIVLMFSFDALEIALMPPRRGPGLWWVRILTDFGKDAYVLSASFAALLVVAIGSPLLQGASLDPDGRHHRDLADPRRPGRRHPLLLRQPAAAAALITASTP